MNGYIPLGQPTDITVGASPFTFTNPETWPIEVYSNGTITLLELQLGNAAFKGVSLLLTTFKLNPGDSVRVTYVVAPTMMYNPH